MRKILVLALLLIIGYAFADEIEDEILKDLDFYMNLEVVENEELVKNLDAFSDGSDSRPTAQKKETVKSETKTK